MRAPDAVFYLINALPFPIWASWIAAPRSKLAQHFREALWPWAVLAFGYVALIGCAMFVVGGKPGAGMHSLTAVMIIFDSEWSTVAGWMHYICFDAFAARWIVNDATPSHRLSPILLLTCFFGPAGLFLYLMLRPRFRAQR
jgi:hypothetical protein